MAFRTIGAEGGVRSRLMAALSYMGVMCLVPLIMNRQDEFVYFHARQGLVIWMWSVLAMLALYLPGVGKRLFTLSALLVVAFSLVGLVSVLLKKAWKLPLVYSIAARM